MNKRTITRLITMSLCVGAAAVLFAAYHHVRAQGQATSKATPTSVTATPAPEGFVGPHVLNGTYFTFGNNVVPVGAGFQALDIPTTVTCANSNGCAIGIEQQVQMGENTTATNRWAICSQVDGLFLSTPYCPYVGYLPTDGSFMAASFAQQTSVATGSHTVQTYVYTDYGASESIYTIIYRVYHQ
jgi:hypothetical protein